MKSLSYGGPVTNLTLQTELPPAPPTGNDPFKPTAPVIREESPLTNRAPPRPVLPQYQIDQWTSQDGLPSNKINALLQTHDGYLWIGTVAGLVRFDGVRFTVFDELNSPEMASTGSNVRALFEDAHRRLWIGTRSGLLCRENGRFIHFPRQEVLQGTQVLCFAPRAAGGFWLGANERLGHWDGRTIVWDTSIKLEAENYILALAEGRNKVLWIGCRNRLYGLDLRTDRPIGPLLVKHDRISVGGLLRDRSNKLWIGSSDGVWWLQPDSAQPIPAGREHASQYVIPRAARFVEDHQGNVWATTDFGDGLVSFLRKDGDMVATHFGGEMGDTLCITVDAEGAVWVGTRDRGLFRLRHRTFTTLAFGNDSSLNHLKLATEAPDRSIWFAGDMAFFHWSGRSIRVCDIVKLRQPYINAASALSSGSLWASFPSGGTFEPPLSDRDSHLFQPVIPHYPEVGLVQVIYPRRDQSVWLGTMNGLYLAKGESSVERIESVGRVAVQAILEDRQNNLWIGTGQKGLLLLKPDDVRAFTKSDGLPSDDVKAIHLSEDGVLWLGTAAGLCRFQGGRAFASDPESQLPQDETYSILEDDFHRLWISHATGIARVARGELEAWVRKQTAPPAVANFGEEDGLLSSQITGGCQPAAVKGSDGRLWFATHGGLAVVDPAECPTNTPPPQVWIEKVVVNGKSLPSLAPARLPPGSGRNMEIRFTATSLHSPEKVRIRCRMEGQDSGWRESSSVRQAVFAKLEPGSYRFRVQARNHEGRWSEQDAVFAFVIAPFFWQTNLFYVTGGLILSGLIGGFVAWRIRRERRRQELMGLKALEAERARIASDIHDHLGAQLTELAFALGQHPEVSEQAHSSLRELGDTIWAVHPDNDTLDSLAEFISDYSNRYCSTANLKLELDLPPSIPPYSVCSIVRRELTGMFKEALRNVVQHANASAVRIKFETDERNITLSIRDDGCGFDATPTELNPTDSGKDECIPHHSDRDSKKNRRMTAGTSKGAGSTPPSSATRGNGLKNFYSRAAALGGSCRIESTPGQGTYVEFSIPLENQTRKRSQRWFRRR